MAKRLQLGSDPLRDLLKSVLSKLEIAEREAPAKADFSCSATCAGFVFPVGNARAKRANCGCVSEGEK